MDSICCSGRRERCPIVKTQLFKLVSVRGAPKKESKMEGRATLSGHFLHLKSCGCARIERPLTGLAVAQKVVFDILALVGGFIAKSRR